MWKSIYKISYFAIYFIIVGKLSAILYSLGMSRIIIYVNTLTELCNHNVWSCGCFEYYGKTFFMDIALYEMSN